jgi:peptidoglycan/LPS O-acetylase OafA/YrhL
MINTFRYYLNKQGRLSKELNGNSYSVYIIHVIVIGGIALTMLNTAIPSLLKYLILTVSTYIACNLIVYFYRKVIKSKIELFTFQFTLDRPKSVYTLLEYNRGRDLSE